VEWQNARKILCIRLDSLGDVLMTTPAIRALKEGKRDRQVTLLTSKSGAKVAPLVPEIDEVIVYDPPWMKTTPARKTSQYDQAFIEKLRTGQYDGAVIFTVFSQSPLPAALTCYLAGIPRRLACCRENPYQLLTDWVREIDPGEITRHEVRRQLDLVAAIGYSLEDERMRIRVPETAKRHLAGILHKEGIDLSQPWIVIHPGASAPSRRYSPQGFARVASRLFRDLGLNLIFTGTRSEMEMIGQIQAEAGVPSVSLAGRLPLPGLAALLEAAPMLLSNNTGPVHLAASVGTPVVDLYALTNPQHTPWRVPSRVLNHDVPCKFCYKSVCPEGHHNCLRLVHPQKVVQAVASLMKETNRELVRDW